MTALSVDVRAQLVNLACWAPVVATFVVSCLIRRHALRRDLAAQARTARILEQRRRARFRAAADRRLADPAVVDRELRVIASAVRHPSGQP